MESLPYNSSQSEIKIFISSLAACCHGQKQKNQNFYIVVIELISKQRENYIQNRHFTCKGLGWHWTSYLTIGRPSLSVNVHKKLLILLTMTRSIPKNQHSTSPSQIKPTISYQTHWHASLFLSFLVPSKQVERPNEENPILSPSVILASGQFLSSMQRTKGRNELKLRPPGWTIRSLLYKQRRQWLPNHRQ